MIAALIGAGVTLLVTVITQITSVFISKYKSNLEIKQNVFYIVVPMIGRNPLRYCERK